MENEIELEGMTDKQYLGELLTIKRLLDDGDIESLKRMIDLKIEALLAFGD